MKKIFSFISVFALAAILGVSSVSAQKTVVTMEKLWSKTIADMGVTAGETRQGAGADGTIYLLNKTDQSFVAVTAEGKDTICVGPLTVSEGVTAKLDGTAYALDDAGNFVMEGTFPNTPSHLVLRKADGSVVKDLAITGLARTDYINANGDLFSAEGGYVFVYGNKSNLLIYNFVNGELVGEPIQGTVPTTAEGYVIAGDATTQIAHFRSSDWQKIENGAATPITGLEGLKKSTLGGDIITLAGKEFYIYPAGTTNYSSEFSVRNMTDGAFVADKNTGATIFCANTLTGKNANMCSLHATKIDDNNAYVHVYNNGDGAAVFKLSAVVAATVTLNCDATMGTVEGAGDYAVGGNATVKAIPALGYSFVAWKNGEETVSTEAEYTFAVTGDVALTAVFQKENDVKLTLAVNDATLGTITLPEGIVLGENTVAYGTKVALTAVPAEGCTFLGWYEGDALYAADYTIEVAATADLALTANFVKVLKLEYDLGGGVTNDYGWTSKGAVALELQKDYNAAYNTAKEWAKAENGYIYYYLSGTWVREDQVPEGTACTVTGFIQNVTYNETDNMLKLITDTHKDKYAWLNDIILATRTAAGLAGDLSEAIYRKEISAFFLCSPEEASWPAAPSYAVAGTYESFKTIWKHGFDNPAEVVTEVTLNEPYHPELTFYGWYANAEFTGDKYVKVSPETVVPGGKLYAHFDEYIPTIAEVWAMEEGVETKISGVVNWARKGNVFIQDATGGFLIYNSGLEATVGTKIIAKGVRGSFNGKPQLSNAVIESTEAATLMAPVATTLSELHADTTSLKYFGQRVQVLGVYVAEYDTYGNLWVEENGGVNKTQCYYMTPDQSAFPVGSKISLTAVASSNKGVFQFEGDVAGVEYVVAGKKEEYTYPTRYDGKYTLENDWVISSTEDNFAANAPGATDHVRGMAVKDGIMYFINSINDHATNAIIPLKGQIVRVDGKTGSMLSPIDLKGEHLFERATTDSVGNQTWAKAVTLAHNDLKFDQAGNCLIGACVGGGGTFQIYLVDLETGNTELILQERLYDNPDFTDNGFRFDAFGVAGDVKSNGVIMAADANSWNVYRWIITDGVPAKAEQITCIMNPETDKSLWIDQTAFGTAPQIFPQDETGSMFYTDGWNTLPMFWDENGMLLDDFINVPTQKKVWNAEGDTISMQQGHNGLVEFQVGEDYFLLLAATNTATAPYSSFALFKFADANRLFEGMEPMWYFPKKGMGTITNGCRTAVPSVEVAGNVAHLYLYTNNNGYARYTMTVSGGSALEEVGTTNQVDVEKVLKNGQVYIIKNGVKYNILGAQVK